MDTNDINTNMNTGGEMGGETNPHENPNEIVRKFAEVSEEERREMMKNRLMKLVELGEEERINTLKMIMMARGTLFPEDQEKLKVSMREVIMALPEPQKSTIAGMVEKIMQEHPTQ